MFAGAKIKQRKEVRHLQCQEQCIDYIPYYLSRLSRAHFSDNLSRNSCISNTNTPASLCKWQSFISGTCSYAHLL